MLYLKQSTASQSVKLGPFVDSTDGVTAETGLTIANTDIKLSKNGGTMASKNSGGGTHDADGYYTVTLDATDTNTVGTLQLSCSVSGALPVFKEFQVLEEAVYDALFAASATGKLPATLAAADVTGNLPADAVAISGDTTAANNLELAFDGTGYGADPFNGNVVAASVTGAVASVSGNVGGNVTGSVGSIDGITFPTNFADLAITATTGQVTVGTNNDKTGYSLTSGPLDAAGVRSAVGLASANLDTQLGTLATSSALTTVDTVVDAIKVVTDKMDTSLEADGSSGWQFTTLALENGPSGGGTVTANVTQINGTAITGTGSQVAAAFEHFFDVATPSKTINDCGVAGSGLSAQDVWEYDISAISTAGQAGKELNDASNANTTTPPTAAAIRAEIDSNSTQLAAIVEDTGTTIPATLGTLATSAALATVDSNVDAILTDTGTTLPAQITALNDLDSTAVQSACNSALVAIHLDHLLAADYDPASKPGTSTALLNELIESDAGVSRFTANALEQAPSGGGGGDATEANQTTIIGHLTDIKGASFSTSTDSLEAIRDRGDAAWTTGAGGSPPQLLQSTTIATLSSQKVFTLTAGSADDNAYNGATVVITDQSTSTQKAVGRVLDYTGSTKTITLYEDPGIFTMAAGDSISIMAGVFVSDGSGTGVGWLG